MGYLNTKCRNCGTSLNDRRSKKKCDECEGVELYDLIPKETKGQVCVMYANGSSMRAICSELQLSYGIVARVIDNYLGIGELPVLVHFNFIDNEKM